MKRYIAVLLILAAVIALAVGCMNPNANPTDPTDPTDPAAASPTYPYDPENTPWVDPALLYQTPDIDEALRLEIEALWQENAGYPLRWYTPYYFLGAKYYGTYNGCHIIFRPPGYLPILEPLELVEGYAFPYFYNFNIYAVTETEGNLSLQEAYDRGLLTDGDIAAILAHHESVYEWEQTLTAPPPIEQLPATEQELQEAAEATEEFPRPFTADELANMYFGRYGDCLAFIDEYSWACINYNYRINGYTLHASGSVQFYFYYNGEFYFVESSNEQQTGLEEWQLALFIASYYRQDGYYRIYYPAE